MSEFRALVVDAVDETHLPCGTTLGDVSGRDLPVQLVKLPVDDLSHVAVLSWRWDTEQQAQPSRNLLSAIRQAKQMGVRYLFIDIISIDQQLRGDALIEHVVAFTVLFKTIPVIAAYDKIGENFLVTMRRPWILYEARSYRYHPTKIVYVGHNNQGAENSFGFRHTTRAVWGSSFTHTILGVLCGEIGMKSIFDIKFIMPAYAQVLTPAYQKMSRNDYLLTAILCQVHAGSRAGSRVNSSTKITEVEFNRYSLSRIENPPGYSSSWDVHDISLDGTKIARWEYKYNMYLGTEKCVLRTLPKAECAIFTALCLTDSDYSEYAAQEETRRASLLMEDERNALPPKLEVVSIKL
jgi:hypothetical protein